MSASRIYVGNLPLNVRREDLLDIFERYGRIREVSVKTPSRPPAFAFVEFEDVRDAEDAVKDQDGRDFGGERLRVEFSRGPRERRDDRFGGSRGLRTAFKVEVDGVPSSVSWQDLKDFLREGGDVIYTNVNRDGTGVGEFATYDDMKRAIRKLDDTQLRGEYVRLREIGGGRGDRRSRSRSPPRRRYRSRSRSPRARRHRSRSRSPRRRSRSRSPKDRSPPRSPAGKHSRSRSPVSSKVDRRSRSPSPAEATNGRED